MSKSNPSSHGHEHDQTFTYRISLTPSCRQFHIEAGKYLESAPYTSNIIATTLGGLMSMTKPNNNDNNNKVSEYQTPPGTLFMTVYETSHIKKDSSTSTSTTDKVVGACFVYPPMPPYLDAMPPTAASKLAKSLWDYYTDHPEFPAHNNIQSTEDPSFKLSEIRGCPDACAAFGDRWAELSGGKVKPEISETQTILGMKSEEYESLRKDIKNSKWAQFEEVVLRSGLEGVWEKDGATDSGLTRFKVGGEYPSFEEATKILHQWIFDFDAEAFPGAITPTTDDTSKTAKLLEDRLRLIWMRRTASTSINNNDKTTNHPSWTPVCFVGVKLALADGAIGRIGPVYTPPHQRSKGYASRSVAYATKVLFEGDANKNGRNKGKCGAVMLFVDDKNKISRKVYESLGYKESGTNCFMSIVKC
jgi:ribosomal protein S18 acetylase RimI-like enzyme